LAIPEWYNEILRAASFRRRPTDPNISLESKALWKTLIQKYEPSFDATTGAAPRIAF
jgi:hypothetical protein